MKTIERIWAIGIAALLYGCGGVSVPLVTNEVGCTGKCDSASGAQQTQQRSLWYMPATPGSSGVLPDFTHLFKFPNTQWPISQARLDVFTLVDARWKTEQVADSTFTSGQLVPFLSRTGIAFGLETLAPTFASCETRAQKTAKLNKFLSAFTTIADAGASISYVSIESTLSKVKTASGDVGCPNYTLAERISDIVWFMNSVNAALGPAASVIKYQLVDATLSKGTTFDQNQLGVPNAKAAYEQLLPALADAGLNLSSVMIDIGWEDFADWNDAGTTTVADVVAFQSYLIDHGIDAGVEITTGAATSPSEYCAQSMQEFHGLWNAGAPGKDWRVLSWQGLPNMELPEKPANADACPLTDVLRRVAVQLP